MSKIPGNTAEQSALKSEFNKFLPHVTLALKVLSGEKSFYCDQSVKIIW